MPSIVTHHIFAKDILKKLPEKVNNQISYEHFIIFAQSFDNLFYYKFLTPWKGKEIRDLGIKAQKEKVNLYFKNLLNDIKDNNYQNNKEILAYLYGSICHYVLDFHAHPYIFYYTGNVLENKKYRGLHEKMEVNIDAYMYKKVTKKNLADSSLADTLLPKIPFSEELLKVIDTTFEKTFSKKNMGRFYESSVKTGNFLLKYGVKDKWGLKKILYYLKDLICFNSKRKYQYLSFHVTSIEKEYLNLNHEIWHHPVTNKISKKSFEDLYEDAIKETIKIIKKIDLYLDGKESIDNTLKIIKNLSYTTGLPCNQKEELKYFKF